MMDRVSGRLGSADRATEASPGANSSVVSAIRSVSHDAGLSVECAQCGGCGLVAVWSFGVKEPDECSDCCGSGHNWQYPRGAIAKYYGGPLIGRAPRLEAE